MKKTVTLLLALAYTCGFAQESKALTRLKKQTNASVTISNSTSNPNFIAFRNAEALKLKSSGAKAKAAEFLADNYGAFNLRSANDLVFVEERTDNYGLKNVIYRQQHQGIPVYDGLLKFHFNGKEELTSINGNAISNIKVNATPDISADQAADIAKSLVAKQDLGKSSAPLQSAKSNLLIFPRNLVQGGIATPYLAYEVEVTNKVDVREFLFIDA
ncbi:MAG: bacillolysin, partial [Chryseobacterium sp.]